MLDVPLVAELFELFGHVLWSIIWHACLWNPISGKVYFQLLNDSWWFGVIQDINFPKRGVVVDTDEVVVAILAEKIHSYFSPSLVRYFVANECFCHLLPIKSSANITSFNELSNFTAHSRPIHWLSGSGQCADYTSVRMMQLIHFLNEAGITTLSPLTTIPSKILNLSCIPKYGAIRQDTSVFHSGQPVWITRISSCRTWSFCICSLISCSVFAVIQISWVTLINSISLATLWSPSWG